MENEAYQYILFYCAVEEDYLALYSYGKKKTMRLSINFISSHIDYSKQNHITQYLANAIKSQSALYLLVHMSGDEKIFCLTVRGLLGD